ncbi:DUF6461 domain-containing protein [Winogradskya humida]|uniref:Uncharacterized protein n=1 Tax=Winogradskya humida TaxID=113566 RepID=A0ABQ3ZIZ3_9ACTN|nr:DUF6461 domain-containing protein [Actinoplanes humidus]GIE18527.1 hypothetical protein Ahu01nite_016290 [Actinoplanes humidus]
MDDLLYAQSRVTALGNAWCLTFIKAVDERTALLRMGAYPDTIAVSSDFQDRAAAITLGKWALVIEPRGVAGGDHVLLEEVSRGTEALSVLRDDQATPRFTYALDGAVAVAFDPAYPSPELTWGTQPDMLAHLTRAIGLREPDGEDDETWRDAEAKALVLAQRLTNARVPADALTVPRLSAQLEPWFVGGVRPGDLLRARGPLPAGGRDLALTLLREQAAKLGIADAPGLSETLSSGGPVRVESELGRQVRVWLAEPGTYGAFTTALRGVLDPDPDVALRAALRPLSPEERATYL